MKVQKSPFFGQVVTVRKPLGKDISLKIGEIVEGVIVEVFPHGGAAVKIKGGTLPVRTALPLKENEILLLEVLGPEKEKGEWLLKYLGKKEKGFEKEPPLSGTITQEGAKKDLSALIGLLKRVGANENLNLDSVELKRVFENILKVISHDPNSLNEDIKINLTQLLPRSLKERLSDLALTLRSISERLPQGWIKGVGANPVEGGNFLSMETLNGPGLKEALENGGVLFETKLRALADESLFAEATEKSLKNNIINDFKYILLKYKDIIEEKINETLPGNLPEGWTDKGLYKKAEEVLLYLKETLKEINSLLKEVETFQFLSKVADAFVVFLPIPWSSLRQGELVFKKKGRPAERGLFSCGIRLQLEGVGEISVLLLMFPGNTFGLDMKVEDPLFKALLTEGLGELKERFEKQGLHLTPLALKGESESAADPFTTVLSEKGLIDIRI